MDSSPEQIQAVVDKVKQAGIKLYGGGVIYMNNPEQVDQAFRYAKLAGMEVISGVPEHGLLELVNRKVQEYDIKVAIHNHGPGDKRYPTPDSVYERIKDLDKRIGLCNDIGHTQRSGIDPAESIEKYADRLIDIDLKDVSQSAREGETIEIGRGVVDMPKVIRALINVGFNGVAAFEFEKDADDPLTGLAESVGFVRGIVATV